MPDIQFLLEGFQTLRAKATRHERIAGIYILHAGAVPDGTHDVPQTERFLRGFAAQHGFAGPDVGDEEWKHAEVFREDARERIVHALVGGAEIGHSRWDVPPDEAGALADEFLSLFAQDARFFCDNYPAGQAQMLGPYARPDFYDYIFGGGCVAVDAQLAAILWVLDND
jgi:hypothetical protein